MSNFQKQIKMGNTATLSTPQTMNVSAEAPVVAVDQLIPMAAAVDEGFQQSDKYEQYDSYYDSDYCIVDANKIVSISPSHINITQEENSQVIPFELNRYYDGVDLMNMNFRIHYVNSSGNEGFSTPINVSYSTTKIRFYWLVDGTVTAIKGNVAFEIQATGTNENGDNYMWLCQPNRNGINILESLSGNGIIQPDNEWYTQFIRDMDQKVAQARTYSEEAKTIVAQANEALQAVNDKIADVTDVIADEVVTKMQDELAKYCTKEQVNEMIEAIDFTSVIEEVQAKIDKIDGLDKLSVTYDTVTNVLTFKNGDSVIVAHTLNTNPTSEWTTQFRNTMKTDIDDAVNPLSQELTSYKESNDEALSQVQTDVEDIKTNHYSKQEVDAALEKKADASNVENLQNSLSSIQGSISDLDSSIELINDSLTTLEGEIKAVEGMEQLEYDASFDEETRTFTLTENGEPKTQFTISGGGGGGGGTEGSVVTIERVTPANSNALLGDRIIIKYNFTSVDTAGDDTGNGTAVWSVGNTRRASTTAVQGENSFDITDYLVTGSNKVKLTVTDSVGNMASKNWTITVIDFKVESTFDDSLFYNGEVTFRYIPYGDIEKVIHFELDGEPLTTVTTSATGRQLIQNISAQKHGSHLLCVYMTANLNNSDIRSASLYKDIIWVDQEDTTPIIGCAVTKFTEKQYNSHTIPYVVYDPLHNPASITLSEDDDVLYTQTVDRTRQVWSYRSSEVGEKTLKITCRDVVKEITVTIEDIGIEIQPVETNLAFDFNPAGRSNNDAERIWTDGTYHMTVSDNFDWVNGGYQIDEDGDTYFCVKAGTTATLNYKLFGDDAKKSGKNFKLIYKATNVRDYDAKVLECKDGNIGFVANAQIATLSSSLTSTSVQYCEDYYMEMEFNILPDNQFKEMMFFMDAIPCEPKLYDTTDNFTQTDPKDIVIGSSDCDVWVYRMKAYTMSLTDDEILDNRIADAKNATEMMDRYFRNQIVDASGELNAEIIYENCPDLRVIKIECPTFTTGKKNEISNTTIQHMYKNGRAIEDNWTATGTHKGQGTSSEYYGESGRNIDINCSGGFTFSDGSQNAKYAMTENSVPEKYFNIKVNVASSENANNACNAERYHKYNPYIRQARLDNPKVRDTMEFHPCVIFVRETDVENSVEFHDGQWHFYACGDFGNSKKNSDAMGMTPGNKKECIVEVLNNTSAQCRFLSDDLTEEKWDGDGNFEMRYTPDGLNAEEEQALKQSWQRVLSWVVNADKETFVKEFENYFVKDSLLYTYLFTNRFMMVDNRAKNTFYHTTDGEHWDACFDYDNDTSMGNDNEGGLTLRYGYEDTDTIGNKSVFNASDSKLFCFIRDYMQEDLNALYLQCESAGAWSAQRNLQEMEAYQAVKPERLVMADMRRKYLRPYETKGITSYLDMMHGDKKHQRRQFEKYHEKYMASKYLGAAATSDVITMRCYTPIEWNGVKPDGTLHITPYADMYISVRFGSMVVQTRAKRNQSYDILCPVESMNDTEVYTYNASLIRSIGNVSACYIGYCDFSLAVKLTDLLIGSDKQGYKNTNMTSFTVGNNVLLERINLQNLPNLKQALSLAGCANLEELYAEGSGITGVVFANGGNLKTAHIPPITTMEAKNLQFIEDFHVENYDNLTTLTVENCPAIDLVEILETAPQLNRVRFIGVNWTLQDDSLLNKLMTMGGIDENGYNSTMSVLTGSAHVPVVRQQYLHNYMEAWPDLNITYNTLITQFAVTFQNYDNTVLDVQYVDMGGSAVDPTTRKDNPIQIPTKPSSVSTDYTFSGWDLGLDDVFANRTITAKYTESVRKYTVRYKSRNYVLQTKVAPYGSSVAYEGDIPTYTDEEAAYVFYLFTGWDQSGYVDGDKDINAVYDKFTYMDGNLNGVDISEMRPVQIYAMTKMGLDTSLVEIKDSIQWNMGNDFHYNDIRDQVLISQETEFIGTNHIDTDIQLINEDSDWVIAIDYKWGEDNDSRAVLFQCYQNDGSNGFKLWNSGSSSPRITWGTNALASANVNKRDMLVLRHLKGETSVHVYRGNLPADTVDYTALTADRATSSNANTTVVFGSGKADDGAYENHAKGTIYWCKVWFSDLGDDACRSLAMWTHETVQMEMTGFKLYYLSDSSGQRCSMSFLGTNLLANPMPLNGTTNNDGGWAVTSLNRFLNARFYKAIPVEWRQLVKEVKISSSAGNKSKNITQSNCYVAIPAVAEVDASMQYEPYSNEGTPITFIVSEQTRLRRHADGSSGDYWLRSPNGDYQTYWYNVSEDGYVSAYDYAMYEKGVVILLSI